MSPGKPTRTWQPEDAPKPSWSSVQQAGAKSMNERVTRGAGQGRATALIMPFQSSVLRPSLCCLFRSEVARLGVNEWWPSWDDLWLHLWAGEGPLAFRAMFSPREAKEHILWVRCWQEPWLSALGTVRVLGQSEEGMERVCVLPAFAYSFVFF